MKNWKTIGALLIIVLMALTGCPAPTGGDESPGSGMVITEKNVVLKEEALVQPAVAQVQSFDSDTGKITVSGDVAVETGQVFHSGVTDEFPNGALKKVVGVETGADGAKVLITEDAALTDVIENGEYSAEGTLSMEGIKVDSPGNSLVLEDDGENPALLVLDGGLTYAQRFIVNYPITDDVSVHGSFQMALPFNFMLDIKFSELKALDISIEPQFDLELDISGSLVNYKHEQSLATITLQPLTIGVVVITPIVELVLTTTVNGRLEFGVQAKAAFRAGVVYSGETGEWTPYSDKGIDVKFEQPSLVGSIEASMGIKKALKLYGVAGPYFTPEIYAGLKGEYDGDAVSFSAYEGIRARAGGEVTVFSKKLATIDFTLLDVRLDIELSDKTNLLPTADFSYSESEVNTGVYRVSFAEQSFDNDGSIESWEWDFDGDGIADSTERNPSHTFSGVDRSTVTLTVQDNRLGEKSESKTLVFNEIIESVLVKGGTFQMGSTDSDADSDESPVHQVTVSSFYMARTEVTQAQWKAVMGTGNNPSNWKGDSLPVEQASWYEVVEYCNDLSTRDGLGLVYTINGTSVTADFSKTGWRLPTEAEWEYAARGGANSKRYKYSGSNTADEAGWYENNSGNRTQPVGRKKANELGLYDMSGNVYEWCWDWYDGYSSNAQTNPTGPSGSSYRFRVVRGGGWKGSARRMRSTERDEDKPTEEGGYALGFRPVRRL